MRIFDYVCLILILMGVGFIYRKYMDKYDIDSETHEYELIKKNLLSGFIFPMNIMLESGNLFIVEVQLI